jgi:hypothetical protein
VRAAFVALLLASGCNVVLGEYTVDEETAESCNVDGGQMCGDAVTLHKCQSGHVVERPCEDVCGEVGFTSTGCSDATCQCGVPVHQTCWDGAYAHCYCLQWSTGVACTEDEYVDAYVTCYQQQPGGAELFCLGSNVDKQNVDCNALAFCGD